LIVVRRSTSEVVCLYNWWQEASILILSLFLNFWAVLIHSSWLSWVCDLRENSREMLQGIYGLVAPSISCCCNKVPEMRFTMNKSLFFMVLGAEKFKITCLVRYQSLLPRRHLECSMFFKDNNLWTYFQTAEIFI
jgi:hypothetical protein